ncbi:septum formation initiator family protein [Euzebya pacifica]|uniref:septum formation initiator family protein n=1 Tax=Euzebya pacifica TaxID=1608957 RepID=UPI000DF83B4A|nr:septum formation initiator family protein [Euzebya pacifica]
MAEPARSRSTGRSQRPAGRRAPASGKAAAKRKAPAKGRASAKRTAPAKGRAKGGAKGRASAKRTAPAKRPVAQRRPTLRLALGGLVAIVVLLGAMAVGPYADYTAARGRVDTLTDEQLGLLEAVDSLESERTRLEDPVSLEEEARSQLGMTRPGEIPYIVVNPPTEPPVEPDAPAVAPEPPLIERVLETVSAWFR